MIKKELTIIEQLEKAIIKAKNGGRLASRERLKLEKYAWETKREYLEQLLIDFKEAEGSNSFKIFVSFSSNLGSHLYELLDNGLKEFGYDAINGFQGKKSNVVKNVLTQIKSSVFYVGILTKVIKVDNCDEEGNCYMPSIWTMQEKGMALGLDKPFLLLLQDGIHNDFWRKTAPAEKHIFFKDTNDFKRKLPVIIERIDDKLTGFNG